MSLSLNDVIQSFIVISIVILSVIMLIGIVLSIVGSNAVIWNFIMILISFAILRAVMVPLFGV